MAVEFTRTLGGAVMAPRVLLVNPSGVSFGVPVIAPQGAVRRCESRTDEKVLRPAACPFCDGRQIEPAVAAVEAATISWHCLDCNGTWQTRRPSNVGIVQGIEHV